MGYKTTGSSGGGTGTGDMKKSTYDTDLDGIVDKAESLDDGAGNTITVPSIQNISEKEAANGYAGLDADGKVPVSQLPDSLLIDKGDWNASTNTPTLSDATGTDNYVYSVSVGGTQDFGGGDIEFNVGDYVTFNGLNWIKINNTYELDSVAVASAINEVDAKTALVDADIFPLNDSEASYSLKSTLWSNIKSVLKTYFDTLYTTLTLVKNDTDVASAISLKHTQGTDTTLGAMSANVNMNSHKLTGLAVPSSNGDSIRATTKITEANVEDSVDKKHTQNTDTKLDEGGSNEVSAADLKKEVDASIGIPIIIGDKVNEISTGTALMIEMPFAFTLETVRLVSTDGTSGSIVLDIWKDTYANFPPTDADSITNSHEPTISSGTKFEDTDVSDYSTVSFAKGDWVCINVDSVTDLTQVTLSLIGSLT